MRLITFAFAFTGFLLAMPTRDASAAWMVGGVWYSNICRANINPNYYFVYPPQDAAPVGSPCAFPDGTPGTVTPN